jgi:MFS family permease
MALIVTYVAIFATFIHRHGFRNTFIPLYGATVLGLQTGPISIAIAIMAVCGLIVAGPGGALSDRLGRRRVIVSGMFAIAIGDLLYLWTGDVVAFLVVAAIVGLGDFFTGAQAALLADIVEPRHRNRSLSGFRFSVDLGALVGPIMVAVLLDNAGATGAIVATAAILAVAAIATLIATPSSVDQRGPVPAAGAGPR